jgi:hypothetical protein
MLSCVCMHVSVHMFVLLHSMRVELTPEDQEITQESGKQLERRCPNTNQPGHVTV